MKPKPKSDKRGYPRYPDNEDIYRNEEKVQLEGSRKPENPKPNPSQLNKPENQIGDTEAAEKENKRIYTDKEDDDWNEANFDQERTGEDLDVPGSEADDDQEDIGEEDEENNYYSLGGDRHES
ncbi:MAG: hypothetical protein KDC57_14575 [Saprospiraceae bacterium]|nr:hypothetical protein [Saprospiraceae bacterium]